MIRVVTVALAILALATPIAAQDSCGDDIPCEIGTGAYHAALPDSPESAPAVIWLHGYAGSGAKTIANTGFVKNFTQRGYALIAPNGLKWGGEKTKPDWAVRDGYQAYPRNDLAFIRAVIDDAAKRFSLDRSRVLLAGFSRGGSMIWDVACLKPDTATAYAPISGGFWKPESTDCVGPVDLLHTHGFSDRTVPLEGRPIDTSVLRIVQGDIHAGLLTWRNEMNCAQRATAVDASGPLWRKSWTECEGGSVTFLLGPGGHGAPKGWTSIALDWFEALPGHAWLEAGPPSD